LLVTAFNGILQMSKVRIATCFLLALLSAATMPALANEGEGRRDTGGAMTASAVLGFRIVIPERLLLTATQAAEDVALQARFAPGARRVTETIDQHVVTTVAAP
jgi:hypothetical protein